MSRAIRMSRWNVRSERKGTAVRMDCQGEEKSKPAPLETKGCGTRKGKVKNPRRNDDAWGTHQEGNPSMSHSDGMSR